MEYIKNTYSCYQLYGYDQGMMSLINTNHNYLQPMHITSTSPMVGVIVAVYYLGCAVGSVIFSKLGDKLGRKKAIFGCLATAALGNFIMFVTGLESWNKGTLETMIVGRVVMGLGVGGIDAVIPIYSSELASDGARGKALAQEFQMNIFGLSMAFAINLGVTRALGKDNQWAWRIPIVVMQVYPLMLLAVIERLPESPRWSYVCSTDLDKHLLICRTECSASPILHILYLYRGLAIRNSVVLTTHSQTPVWGQFV